MMKFITAFCSFCIALVWNVKHISKASSFEEYYHDLNNTIRYKLSSSFCSLGSLFFVNVFWFRNRHLPVFVSKLQLSERFSDIMILDLISTKPSSLCELLYTYKGSHGCLADNLSYMVFSGYVKESNIFIKMGFETSLVPLTI